MGEEKVLTNSGLKRKGRRGRGRLPFQKSQSPRELFRPENLEVIGARERVEEEDFCPVLEEEGESGLPSRERERETSVQTPCELRFPWAEHGPTPQ